MAAMTAGRFTLPSNPTINALEDDLGRFAFQ